MATGKPTERRFQTDKKRLIKPNAPTEKKPPIEQSYPNLKKPEDSLKEPTDSTFPTGVETPQTG